MPTDIIALFAFLAVGAVMLGCTSDILKAIATLSAKVTHMDASTQTALNNLNTAVAEETTIEQSVETLLNGLSAQIADLKAGQTDPAVVAALDAASALVRGNNDKFKAAVLANTAA